MSLQSSILRLPRAVGRSALLSTSSLSSALSLPGRAVYTRGQGVNGALGNGATDDQDTFASVATGEEHEITSVRSGWSHTAFVTRAGRVLVTGRTHDIQQAVRFGRMSLNGSMMLTLYKLFKANTLSIDSLTPQEVVFPEAIQSLVCGAGVTAALSRSGRAYLMGTNQYGQCGTKSREFYEYSPSQLQGIDEKDGKVTQIALGFRHGIALTSSGAVYTWGKGNRGQCGHGPQHVVDFLEATKVKTLPCKAVSVSAGFNHCVVALDDGSVMQWGKFILKHTADDGKVHVSDALAPTRLKFPARVKRVWTGQHHNVALTDEGVFYQWGRLGDNSVSNNTDVLDQTGEDPSKQTFRTSDSLLKRIVTSPVQVKGLGKKVCSAEDLEVFLGFDNTYIFAPSVLPQPLAWNWDLQPVPVDLFDPAFASLPANAKIKQIAPGWLHTAVLVEPKTEEAN